MESQTFGTVVLHVTSGSSTSTSISIPYVVDWYRELLDSSSVGSKIALLRGGVFGLLWAVKMAQLSSETPEKWKLEYHPSKLRIDWSGGKT